jgi:hypothetical protein
MKLKKIKAWAVCWGWWAACMGAHAAPVLRCHFEVNAEHFEHSFTPTSEPYHVTSVNLADRFRFKAVVLGDNARVDLINLYVSYQTERQPMVLQHVKFVAPVVQVHPASDALTGRVALYSPFLGKELLYGCALHEVQP